MFLPLWYFIFFLEIVRPFRPGSVIADLELTFNKSTYEDYLRERLLDATKENKLGDFQVELVVGTFFPTGRLPGLKSPTYLVAKEIIEDLICVYGLLPTKERSVIYLVN